MSAALFLYGTLRHPGLFATVAGPGTERLIPAVLGRHVVETVAGQDFPMIRPAPGGLAQGVVAVDLTAAQLARLDLYEAPFGFVRVPCTVEAAGGGMIAAEVYRPGPDLTGAGPWSLEAWVAAHGAATCAAAAEIFAHDPPLSGAALARQWPMVRVRADAMVRAAARPGPARLRRAARPGDVAWRPDGPLRGDFFKFAAMRVDHRRFDGGTHTDLVREVMVGVDAALVLPYDVRRDRVLLVEQFRTGPMRRGDPNPWCLEPVAGIIDGGETPEQAAQRECAEEAHLAPDRLIRMFSAYASPGSSTDHFHYFIALCDLPDDHATAGGLVSEAEDLRLHLLSRDAALALIDSGEINVTPLIAMLLWLSRHRARLAGPAPG